MDDDEARGVRAEVSAWLEANWNADVPLAEWRSTLVDSGWACPTWPSEFYGRGLSTRLAGVVAEEFGRAGAVGSAGGSAMALAAPTILEHGSEELKRRLLRPIVTGQHPWCQLFSEPGNGSDLAGLSTRAERDGDEWVINGQKVWTTGARKAMFGMLVARTNFDLPKHRGITYFAFPMTQEGVEVRPLKQMNGYASFNEVFLTDARVPHSNVIGEVGGGWAVALTTLANERGLPSARLPVVRSRGSGRAAREANAEAADYNQTYVWYPQRAGRADLIVEHAQRANRAGDPIVRQEVARLAAIERSARWVAERARAARAQGRQPGPEGSLGKLQGSRIARAAAHAHASIAGAHAMLAGPDSPFGGVIAEILVSVPGQSIAGGTDEIQHNIIGERALGLPKEPSVDADIPFREVRTNPFTRR